MLLPQLFLKKMKPVMYLVFLCLCFYSFSQNKKIDSLKTQLSKKNTNEEKADLYLQISYEKLRTNPKDARNFANKALQIASKEKDSIQISSSYRRISASYNYENDFEKALFFIEKSEKILNNLKNEDPTLMGDIFLNKGNIYYSKTDYYSSFLFYEEAIKVFEKTNNKNRISIIHLNISLLFNEVNDLEKALEYSQKALIENPTEEKKLIPLERCLNYSIGLNNKVLAEKYYAEAVEAASKSNNEYVKIFLEISKAKLNIIRDNNLLAEKILKKLIIKVNKTDNESIYLDIYSNLSKALLNQKKNIEALKYATIGNEIAKKTNSKINVFDYSKLLMDIYLAQNNIGAAKKHMQTHFIYKDSIEDLSFEKGQLNFELTLAEFKNEKEKETLKIKKDKERETLALKKDRLTLLIVVMLIVLFFIYAYNTYLKLKKAYKKVKLSDRAKSAFLSKVTHEIKTPINAIMGFTELLKGSKLNKEQNEFAENIKTSSTILLLMSQDILDTTKLKNEEFKLNEESVDLNNSINIIFKSFEFKLKEKNITYNLEIPKIEQYLIYDKIKLKQVIYNLLNNSFKFTQKGNITLKVEQLKETQKKVTLKFNIIDTGIGIDKKELHKIQDEFYQVKYEDFINDGVGLGLTIVKNILEHMGSNLNITSELGKGSVFSFVLKLKKANELIDVKIKKETKKPIDNQKTKIKKPYKILIVEDNKMNLIVIKKLIESFYEGITLVEAENGKIGVDLFFKEKPSLVIMDIYMPIMNGNEALNEIRKTNTSTPIIACSASFSSEEQKYSKNATFNDYIEKPINKAYLKEILSKYITV